MCHTRRLVYFHGEVSEDSPNNAPTPLGKPVKLIHYANSNLLHEAITGRLVPACLHFANATPMDWFIQKKVTAQTVTHS